MGHVLSLGWFQVILWSPVSKDLGVHLQPVTGGTCPRAGCASTVFLLKAATVPVQGPGAPVAAAGTHQGSEFAGPRRNPPRDGDGKLDQHRQGQRTQASVPNTMLPSSAVPEPSPQLMSAATVGGFLTTN